MNLAIECNDNDFQQPAKWAGVDAIITGMFNLTDDVHTEAHAGQDFVLSTSIVPSPVEGTVAFTSAESSAWGSVFGNSVIIETIDGYRVLLAHLSQLFVSVGDDVVVGTHIGIQGSTGRSTGDHIHIGLTTGDNPWFNKDADGGCSRLLDPMDFLSADATSVVQHQQPLLLPVEPDARSTAAHAAQYLGESCDRLRRMLDAGVPAFALAYESANARELLASLTAQMEALK